MISIPFSALCSDRTDSSFVYGAKVQKKSHICKFLWDFFYFILAYYASRLVNAPSCYILPIRFESVRVVEQILRILVRPMELVDD